MVAALSVPVLAGAGVASAARDHVASAHYNGDWCRTNAPYSTPTASLYSLHDRGWGVDMWAPNNWKCQVVDGNGSGADTLLVSRFFERPSGSVTLYSSGCAGCIYSDLCPYVHSRQLKQYVASGGLGSCPRAPRRVSVRFLVGGPTAPFFILQLSGRTRSFPPGTVTEPAGGYTVEWWTLGSGSYLYLSEVVCSIGGAGRDLCARDTPLVVSAFKRLWRAGA